MACKLPLRREPLMIFHTLFCRDRSRSRDLRGITLRGRPAFLVRPLPDFDPSHFLLSASPGIPNLKWAGLGYCIHRVSDILLKSIFYKRRDSSIVC